MKGWPDLKEAFWAVLEGDAGERERRMAVLRDIDASLPAALDALLAADARGETLLPLDDPEPELPARIGGYDVIARLGAGAMGEVYRARDPRLQRDVAIKVLRSTGGGRADRLARFEREARVLAALRHPRIAHIYGLESVDGAPAIVMELVEGPTLADVIRAASGGLPLSRVLNLAGQIADGLSGAHDQGIVHRDLKPGNIALTDHGDVKILDFGIAKRLADNESAAGAGDTMAGTMLGTPAYMSPEQVRGEPCDRRADIWAFGCLLLELLTGRSPFARQSSAESLAAVLEAAPDLSTLPAATPSPLRVLIRHCLEKEPGRRLRDMADVRLIVEGALGAPATTPEHHRDDSTQAVRHATRPAGRMWIAIGTVIAAGVLVAAGWWARGAPDAPSRVVTSLVLPRDLRLGGPPLDAEATEGHFVVSPDGRRIALVATDVSGGSRLWVVELESGAVQPLAGTDGASSPFWSPDSGRIAFVAGGRLRTIPARGGPVSTVSRASWFTGSWNQQDQILFAPDSRSALSLVPAAGGEPRQVTTLDTAAGEVQHSSPLFLPDGRRFLYFAFGTIKGGSLDPRGVFVGSLDAAEPRRLLLSGVQAVQYADRHLVFVRNSTLMIQPFDPDRAVLSGAAISLIDDINPPSGMTGASAAYSVAGSRVLAYQTLWTESQLELVDSTGASVGVVGMPGDVGDVAVSPDGAEVAVSRLDATHATRDVWVYPVAGGPGRRVTFDVGDEFAPVWSPDGARVLFSAMRGGLVRLFMVDASGKSDPLAVETDAEGLGRFAADWSRDGGFLMYIGGGRAIARSDLWIAPLSSPRDARALLDSTFVETHGRVAPGGGWFAYASNETGRLEVYLDRFPDRGGKRVLSTGGGGWPRWARDGRRLYYVAQDGELMVMDVRPTPGGLDVTTPRRLFALGGRPAVRLDAYAYDVLPDGRFVVNRALAEPTASTITVVLNWRAATRER